MPNNVFMMPPILSPPGDWQGDKPDHSENPQALKGARASLQRHVTEVHHLISLMVMRVNQTKFINSYGLKKDAF